MCCCCLFFFFFDNLRKKGSVPLTKQAGASLEFVNLDRGQKSRAKPAARKVNQTGRARCAQGGDRKTLFFSESFHGGHQGEAEQGVVTRLRSLVGLHRERASISLPSVIFSLCKSTKKNTERKETCPGTYFPNTQTADPSAESLKQQMPEWLKKIPEHTTCQRFTAVLQSGVYFVWDTQLSRTMCRAVLVPHLPSTL